MVEKTAFLSGAPVVLHKSAPKATSLSARRPPTARATDVPGRASGAKGGAEPSARTNASDVPVRPQLPDTDLFSVDIDKLASDHEENLRGFIKTRGSLVSGAEFLYHFSGEVYGIVDDVGTRHLFGIEGYNIGRMIRVDGGWRMLTREMAVYREGNSKGAPLESWRNPYLEQGDADGETAADGESDNEIPVIHVWNDPVNHELLLERPHGKFMVGTTHLDGSVCWNSDIFPRYKSPLPLSLFPDAGGKDMYEAAEMFQLFASADELGDATMSAVRSCMLSWTRVGPWLPWMRMGDRPGRLMYHCRGRKLASFAELPAGLRDFVMASHPEYAAAPTEYSRPNMTSWMYMRKLLESGRPRADGRVAPAEADVATAPAKSADGADAGAKKSLTMRELRAFDGRDGEAVYVSVLGRVFDVSSARRHYGAGQTYHCLAGRDATRALISGDLSCEASVDRSGDAIDVWHLTASQRETIEGWLSFFDEHYPEVGMVSDLA